MSRHTSIVIEVNPVEIIFSARRKLSGHCRCDMDARGAGMGFVLYPIGIHEAERLVAAIEQDETPVAQPLDAVRHVDHAQIECFQFLIPWHQTPGSMTPAINSGKWQNRSKPCMNSH